MRPTRTISVGLEVFAHGETVAILTATPVVDPYSNDPDGEDWDNPTELEVPGVGVADGGSTDLTQAARDAVDSDFDLFFPADAVVTSAQRVVVRGLTCDVAARPFLWRNPFTGWTPGLVVKVKIREG